MSGWGSGHPIVAVLQDLNFRTVTQSEGNLRIQSELFKSQGNFLPEQKRVPWLLEYDNIDLLSMPCLNLSIKILKARIQNPNICDTEKMNIRELFPILLEDKNYPRLLHIQMTNAIFAVLSVV